MFKIIQSHRTENLVQHLLDEYKDKQDDIFDPFIVIVPSMVLGDWLDKTIASGAGISTLVMTKFWGQYQWTLMQEVLSTHNQYVVSQNPNAATLNVPEVAVLSSTVMQWRLFGYLTYYQQDIMQDSKHPLYPIIAPLVDVTSESIATLNTVNTSQTTALQRAADAQTMPATHQDGLVNKAQIDARLWQLANDFARVFNRYLTHRDDWLKTWSAGKVLDVKAFIKDKDALSQRFDNYATETPPWLIEHYIELEAAQHYLWTHLFAGVHRHRVALETVFWQALKDNKADERKQLPKVLRIFTIQQLPQTELDFLQQLSQYMHITLLHYNPSKLFWADIVDKSWLQRQQIINPESVFLRDYGHSLLSRLGKQSRDTFAMLANLSGNEHYQDAIVEWEDRFDGAYEGTYGIAYNDVAPKTAPVNPHTLSLLQRLQNDVLMLDEQATQQATALKVIADIGQQNEQDFAADNAAWYDDSVLANKRFEKQRAWALTTHDNSLSIHSCHSLQRQLEVLRMMIGRWLNEPIAVGAKKRHISDIVVLLPDVERHHALISAIFVSGKGQDGLTLPAKVTGVVDASIRQLWEAIIGFYQLLGSDSARFEAATVLDWLMLAPLYGSFGLTHEQMSRGCDLLVAAGFIRGFDEVHLQQTLDANDYDYRFSFAQALDRLTLGLIMPEAEVSQCLYPLSPDEWSDSALPEMTLPLAQISLSDAPIIEALCQIYTGLSAQRFAYQQSHKAEDWLTQIETNVIHRYFGDVDQTRSMRAIYNAMNGFKSSLRANRHYKQYANSRDSKTTHSPTNLANTANSSQNNSQNNNQNKTPSIDTHLEQKLAGVEGLPLKLSFMLDSIEAELESQQVSAEPTGVITFGRFGALRNVPFELVVMLNMNLSEFPNRDRDNRYDLMKAAMARRGDRVSEDDDNGAFLDALLCARSAGWIFYNGQSLTDTHEHLPANPVSELLQFLQGEVQWQLAAWEGNNDNDNKDDNDDNDKSDKEAEILRQQLPKRVNEWLVTQHPALPFDRSLFEIEVTNKHQAAAAEPADNNRVAAALLTTDKVERDSAQKDRIQKDSVQKDKTQRHYDVINDQLDLYMQRVKHSQRQQFPPAKLWQSVFATLNQRTSIAQLDDTQLIIKKQVVKLPTKQQYQAIATLLGAIPNQYSGGQTQAQANCPEPTNHVGQSNYLGQLGVLDTQTTQSLAALLSLDTATHPQPSDTLSMLASTLFDVHEIDIEGALLYQVRHPAKAFLREQMVHVVQGEAEMAQQEPLALDGLTAYQIHEYLIGELSMQSIAAVNAKDVADKKSGYQKIVYQQVMPAGIARKTTLSNQQQKLQQQCAQFAEQLAGCGIAIAASGEFDTDVAENSLSKSDASTLSLITPTTERAIQIDITSLKIDPTPLIDNNHAKEPATPLLQMLPNTIKLKGVVPQFAKLKTQLTSNSLMTDNLTADDYPQHNPKQWLKILPNSARPEHLLKFWLSHLYWQVARQTTAKQVGLNDGVSIWHFNKTSSDVDEFKNTTTFQLNPIQYETAVTELIKWVIFAKLSGQVAMTLLPKYALSYLDKLEKEGGDYRPKRSDFSNWFHPSYGSDVIFDTCILHPIWQYVLQGRQSNQAFAALTASLTTLAAPLYQPMLQALIPLEG